MPLNRLLIAICRFFNRKHFKDRYQYTIIFFTNKYPPTFAVKIFKPVPRLEASTLILLVLKFSFIINAPFILYIETSAILDANSLLIINFGHKTINEFETEM